jgi:hypothetical protein
MAVGRISGPLLKDNLLRDGVNLAFETDLLFLDVINGRVGIKTKTPTNELSVSGTTRTTNLEVQTQADIATFTVTGSTIASTSGTINLLPSGVNAVVYQSKISVNSDLQITTNTIETTATNSNLAINTVGTGQVTVNANMLVNGDLHATGTITADGNIQLGNQTTDTVTFVAEVSSNILPTADNVYNLGSSSLVWANLYTNAITATNLTTTNFTATGVVNVAGTSTLSGNTTIGATTANTLTVNAKINSDLIPATNAQYNIGTALLLWNNLYGTTFTTTGLTVNGNTVTSTGTNSNLNLIANGSGSVTVPNNTLAVSGNTTVGGTLTVTGTSTLAAVGITGTLTQTGNFTQTSGNFSTTGTINSGAITSTGSLTLPNMTLSGTTITGTTTATNLTLTPYTGKQVEITSSATVDQNLSVLGTLGVTGASTLAAVGITGTLTQTGNFTQTGNTNITGNLTVSTYGQFEKIRIDSNVISTTATNTDLRLVANGTGKVIVPSNNVEITNNLTVNGTTTLGTLNATTVNATTLSDGEINITDNYVTTTTTNRNLELRANGTGKILVPSNTFEVTNNLTVTTGTTSLKATTIVGDVNQTGGVNQTGNYTQTGNLGITGNLTVSTYGQFEKIRIDSNTVSTTATNTDLRLVANGTGKVIVPTNTFEVTNDLTVNGLTTLNTLTATTVTATTLSDGEINITDNYVTTTTTNRNLELRANGTGKILVPSNTVEVTNNLTVTTGTTNLKATAVVGNITHTGSVIQTGNYTQTGNTNITGNLTVSTYGQFEKIRIDSNVLSTTATNTDLSLQANGSGKVIVPNNNVEITNDLTVNGTTRIASLTVDGTLTATTFNTGNINIISNYVTTTLTNSNLELRANGTGKILVPSNTFEVTNNLTVTTGTTSLKTTGIVGTLTQTGDITQTGNVTQTGDYGLTGTLTVGSTAQFKDVKIDNNIITTTLSNNDLQLSAAGTGRIYVPTNDVRIDQNLSVGGTTTTADINSSGTITAVTFTDSNIQINSNTIQTTVSNSNLELRAAGTGLVRVEQLDIQENEIKTNTNADIILSPNGTGIVNVNSTQSIQIPVGTTTNRPTASAGMVRFNTTLNRYEGYNGTNWIRLDGLYDLDENTYVTAEATPGANDNTFRFVTNGTQVADLNATRFSTLQADISGININNNTINTTAPNTDIVLQTTGTGAVKIGNFTVNNNTITNTVAGAITTIAETTTGYFKIAGTNGFVLPSGDSNARPTAFETGMMRFNTTDVRVEIWSGTAWISASGTSGGIIRSEAEDIGILSAIIFG